MENRHALKLKKRKKEQIYICQAKPLIHAYDEEKYIKYVYRHPFEALQTWEVEALSHHSSILGVKTLSVETVGALHNTVYARLNLRVT